ncbi:zinc-ribbon domain-containing protein [Candidatus Bathyarchaeota archaeon]|nr:zinc-ribbon domain-containing protein [Candidatus Bathyarchaeota archaeon]
MGIREIVVDAKKKKGEVSRIMEERKTETETELEELKIRRLIEEEKAKINELKNQGQPIQPQQAQGLFSAIIAQNFASPERAQQYLSSLDEESLNKMALLLAADNPRAEVLTNLMRSPTSNVKDLVEIVKLMRPENGGTDLKGIAEVFKLGIEAGKVNQPQPQSLESAANFVLGIIKPFQESLNTAQQATLTAQLETIRAQIPPSLETQVKNLKAMAGELSLGGGSEKLTEINLTLEKMRQLHDIDMETIRWEKEKFLLGKESDTEKWDKIAGMFAPIFSMPEMRNAITRIGESVGKGIGGATNPSTPTQPQIVAFVCPSCNAELSVPLPPNAPEEVPIKCPKCGTITPAKLSQPPSSQTPPPEQKSTSTRLKAAYT